MRKQIKAALIGMVLAVVVFVATPAKAQNCSECPPGWTSFEYVFVFIGCEYVVINNLVYARCDYIPLKMNLNLQPGEQICESREQAPKPTERVVEVRSDAVKGLRSDSR